ncbi:MAG: GntG family PLP-dependent aldolase, partial [Myxococcota bacterium]|nr:GntG family PLP-dependent aldolase [Myxococcota bacterium]
MIDLRSDTVTKPCQNMLKAMCSAPLGDDVLRDDPTILKLEETIADLLGKDDALFVPSGTMANQIAIWLQSKKGSCVAVEQDAHIYHYEASAPALISNVRLKPIAGSRGIMDIESLRSSFPPEDPHFSPISLVCVEDTANRGGGSIYPLECLDTIADIAHQRGIPTHLDGARLFNAQVGSQIPAARRVEKYDTVSICFSKGLGAPVGSALCMPSTHKKDAIRIRKMLGGGMRQAGVLAAAALYALQHNVAKLEADHQKVGILAQGLKKAGYRFIPPQSNMIYFFHPQAHLVAEEAQKKGVFVLALGKDVIRA